MKTKVAFIIALMVTLFTAVIYVGARPSESVTTNETANITAVSEEVQTNTNNAVTQTQTNSKGDLELVAVDSADIVNLNEVGVYIVQLQDPPLALYAGGIEGLSATNAEANGQQKLDATSSASVAYMDYLLVQQDIALADISSLLGRDVKPQYQYKASLNGFAVELSGVEAASVAEMPDVRYIEPEGEYELHTDSGPAWMGAEGIWDGSDVVGGVGTYGEGIIVGVIDTGIDPWNPSFLDVGDDAYDHTNPWGAGTYVGVCDPADPSYDSTFPCNDKLIGAWGYASLGGDPRDADGHGSHTASTAAGNFVNDTTITTPSGTYTASISGVAPHANIVMYAACCTGAALTAAKDQIILDGVDVVNYSIGSSGMTVDPWSDADAQQWLAARAAGIYVATSAGNSGPENKTLLSPADQPWITAVGASSHDRTFLNSVTLDDGVQAPVTLDGWSMTGPLSTPVEVVFSSAYTYLITDTGEITTTITADDIRLCATKKETGNSVFPPGTFSGEIIVCERGKYGRVEKGENVLTGGAGGYILAQPDEFGGGPGSLAPDPHVLPAVHIDYDTYQTLLAYKAAAGSNPVMGTIAGTVRAVDDAYGDVMASFSSRGANKSSPDLIVPSITAPGRAIWAAYHQGDADGDYTYNVIQGTSMSSPHVAGAFALMKALHPTWTPAEVQSAIMTTARDTVLNDDGVNVATPFAQGSGHVDLGAAANAGFVMDITNAEYIAADPATGGRVKNLNTASLGDAQCLGDCSWTRIISSTQGVAVTWNTSVVNPLSTTLTIEPATFVLAPYGTQVITVTADALTAAPGVWAFGSVALTTAASGISGGHLPVAVKPTNGILPASIEINTRRDAGSVLVEDIQSIETTDLSSEMVGLVEADLDQFTLLEDPTNDDAYDDLDDVFWMTMTVPANAYSLIAEIKETASPDIDLFVGMGSTPSEATEECKSASSGSAESCILISPDAGTWWVLVQSWTESTDAPDSVLLATAVVDNSTAGNSWATGPATAAKADPYDIRVYWDGIATEDSYWYGYLSLGASPATAGNIGDIPVFLTRYADDVTKVVDRAEAPVDGLLNYTITIEPNVTPIDLAYMITDTIPTGLTLVPDTLSASQGIATESGGVITWAGTMIVPTRDYVVSTSLTDPLCAMPLAAADGVADGYLNLEMFGLRTSANITGTNTGNWEDTTYDGNPYGYYGNPTGTNLYFTDEGYVTLDVNSVSGGPYANEAIPSVGLPNAVMSILWNQMEIVYDADTNKGVTTGVRLTSGGVPSAKLLEFDDVQLPGDPSSHIDFEVAIYEEISDESGAYEVRYAYDNITGAFNTMTVGSIGIENHDGSVGTQYAYNDAALQTLQDGMAICFDWALLDDSVTITYQATVDVGVATGTILTNTVAHEVDSVGSEIVDIDVPVEVVDIAYGVDLSGNDAGKAMPGETVSYMVTVTNTGNVTDTFDIMTIGTWDTQIDPITLLWGETATFMVDVKIPASAPNGSFAMSTVTATSQGDDTEFDVTVLRTTVEVFYVFMPVIMK